MRRMALPFFAEQLHSAIKIYAHRTVRESGTSRDFRPSYSFNKTQDQRLAIDFGQFAYRIQQRDAVFDCNFPFRILWRFSNSSLLVERVIRLRPAMKIGCAVTCNRGEPRTETRNIAKCCKLWQGLQENVMDQILGSCAGNPRQQNSVHHPDVALVQMAESGAIAALCSFDQRFVTGVFTRSGVHGWPFQKFESLSRGDCHICPAVIRIEGLYALHMNRRFPRDDC